MIKKLNENGLPLLEGYFVLSERPIDGRYLSQIENSFSIDTSHNRAQFFWSSKNATSNFGGSFSVDGLEMANEAKKFCERQWPQGPSFKVWDVHDPELPIIPNWRAWEAAVQPSQKTLSGVVDKYTARNVPYETKEEAARALGREEKEQDGHLAGGSNERDTN